MKPTWELTCYTERISSNCRCLTCGKEFTFLGDGHFNMRLIKCPTCNQEVWVPRCPSGCPSFDAPESRETSEGDNIKFDDYIPEDVKNEEHY